MTIKLALPKDIADTLRAREDWIIMCAIPISMRTINVNFVLYQFSDKKSFQVFWDWTIAVLKELWAEGLDG